MEILEGKVIAEEMYDKLAPKVFELRENGVFPHLAAVFVGDNPESALYISLKEKQAKKVGIDFSVFHIDASESNKEVLDVIKYLNEDENTHGIIVQLPLPDKFDTDKILAAVAPEKDVDGLKEGSNFMPPAPAAIRKILDYYDVDLAGRNIVIMGKGRLVGQPLEKIFAEENIEVQTVDEKTKKLVDKIKQADVLIAATGAEGIVTEELVHSNMTVISVGREVNYERVKDQVEAMTPLYGGVGPLTIAFLLANTVIAAERQTNEFLN